MHLDMIVSGMEALCIVGGASASQSVLEQAAPFVGGFIGVDAGADHLHAAGISPQAVLGDLDSISQGARTAYADRLHYLSDQSTTDFEKALSHVQAPALIAVGFSGDRTDHTLSVLSAMRADPAGQIVLLDENDASFFAQAGETVLDLPKNARVSVMPVTPACVTLAGVVWPFKAKQMQMGGFTSPSNAALGGPVELTTDAPVLVTLGQAHLATALKAVVRAK